MVMLVMMGIRLSGGCKLGSKCAFKHTEQVCGEHQKRQNSAVVTKTLDIAQAGKEVPSFKLKRWGTFFMLFEVFQ